jgi:N-acetylglucosamine-6-phosphate deacetylase
MKSLLQDVAQSHTWYLTADKLFDGHRYHSDRLIRIEGSEITEISQIGNMPDDAPIVHTDRLVSPGYVDLQINGGGGVLFNNVPTPAAIMQIGDAHLRTGTTSWLPTFITDTADKLSVAADAVIATIGKHGVAGFHIEGPHINRSRKGAHAENLIRTFDDQTMSILKRLHSAGVPTMLTLAPECLPAGVIERLRALGVIVSIGHTAASASDVHSALQEGATCFTHLHNAMPPMTARDPGVVGMALDSDAWCGIIADGVHVCDTTLAISLRSRPRADRSFLVSDAMATVGGPGEFELYGERIRVSEGRLVDSRGSLAGAHITLAESVAGLVKRLGVALETALAMATSIPAEAMNLGNGIGHLRVGGKADFLLLDASLTVAAVIHHGQPLTHDGA